MVGNLSSDGVTIETLALIKIYTCQSLMRCDKQLNLMKGHLNCLREVSLRTQDKVGEKGLHECSRMFTKSKKSGPREGLEKKVHELLIETEMWEIDENNPNKND